MDFEANWMDARSFCKTFDMDLATFESGYEFSHFLKKALSHKSSFDRWTHIGENLFCLKIWGGVRFLILFFKFGPNFRLNLKLKKK